jgi:hypothetical protein
MVPRKVDRDLRILEAESGKVMGYDLVITPGPLRLHHELAVPLSDVLVDYQHLQISVWGIIVKGLVRQPVLRKWLFF